MNIFVLDENPKLCAQYHCDKHVIKMILETTQLLCSAHHINPNEYIPIYKLTHKNHPCSIWTRQSINNYLWLCQLGLELCKEYTYRYEKIHKCENFIKDLTKNIPNISLNEITPFALAMPKYLQNKNDPVLSYRNYYIKEKQHILNWKKREVPKWVKSIRKEHYYIIISV